MARQSSAKASTAVRICSRPRKRARWDETCFVRFIVLATRVQTEVGGDGLVSQVVRKWYLPLTGSIDIINDDEVDDQWRFFGTMAANFGYLKTAYLILGVNPVWKSCRDFLFLKIDIYGCQSQRCLHS